MPAEEFRSGGVPDPVAANEAAWRDFHHSELTSQATADAAEIGNSGKVVRLCGVLGSNDSSPPGKHLAAVAILCNPGATSTRSENLAHLFL
ncbi:MAG: hypothetical protein ACREEB_16280 [Caulobacteraceae bacterium]